MDKSLESFLHPHRKPNAVFHLTSFEEEFEMRQLSAKEGVEIGMFTRRRNLPFELSMIPNVAAALVRPNLHSAELLEALSEKAGHKILEPYDAALELFTDSELATLVRVYSKLASVETDFEKSVKEAKNA
jgi:hypothetical protein